MSEFKNRIAGVMLPRDQLEIAKIEKEMENESSDKLALKQEYDKCLKKCVCLELVQIKDFYQSNQETTLGSSQKGGSKHLEVRTTTKSKKMSGQGTTL